ncbi:MULTISPECIES: Rossmann-like and DUF2520 domain-containing protein [unclassified Flavobacterium]|jgi:predicted short-subunit dehydrogenase-like oxidoreductase (DUF2520 family)|uniref:Rossmann-like and DUF2520 domain-containing protein n=1 Tax=unclassified Flavobacterium TaxID=196869 RepID=UPI0012A810CC|nr:MULTISPECIES: Rossmann-like and DUF2520 domain-containing protein [unclassified Flavobacterium]MBF4487092.1 DUF2520 domain-containing protein [Flavobacterium sp. CSZ]QGK73932.1 DUF2520 domain-containing protein [Flavobacterium sp. SLB02]
MTRITIIGSGNVAQHLIKAFTKSELVEIVQVYSRKKETLSSLIEFDKITSDFEELQESDLYIIAVSDKAIADVSRQLPFHNRIVVHTSGAASLDVLDAKNRKGVFYPLQTFSKNKEIDFSIIPLCLEAENTFDFRVLETVAKSVSNAVFAINSDQRKALHVAAVFVNNFTNHLYHIGQEICEEHQVPFEILRPLIQETAEKINTLNPVDAQTGPAKRNDSVTIDAHLAYLTSENQKNIYKLITQSIQDDRQAL